ncbi:hypothetical protein [Parvularcula sp. LCG005]|uniref:hypothetical protein n=1 Tax=Parvularcula sp. LCG005 TaxID=3078805 RepID=UPI0029424F98|nr:hypothetical protein [Parvularcula sp. LCG005]WOI51989.1 hypothetical protein RUI03_07445 [Parvularcula sp. LCG005]
MLIAVTPFQFGSSLSPLYGAYHPPMRRVSGAKGVVICPPWGEEGIRSARLLRVLAERLAAQGSPTLRFDYPCSGESAGDCEDFSLANAVQSVADAHIELEDMSGQSRNIWLGLRFGALAAMKALKLERPIGLLLWDPVVSGPDYLAEMQAAHARAISGMMGRPPASEEEVLGFGLSASFRSELEKTDLSSVTGKTRPKTLAIRRRDVPGLAAWADSASASFDEILDPTEQDWNSDEAMNAHLVPMQTIEEICRQVAEW